MANGQKTHAGAIATDPRILPIGSKVTINGVVYVAKDTGGRIKGNKVDIYMASCQAALKFGKQKVQVGIL